VIASSECVSTSDWAEQTPIDCGETKIIFARDGKMHMDCGNSQLSIKAGKVPMQG